MTERIKPEVKAEWIKALRSGEYEQGMRYLALAEDPLNDNSPLQFCCLGVLCELAVKAGVEIDVAQNGGVREYDSHDTLPPDAVVRWAGLAVDDPSVEGHALSVWNDGDYGDLPSKNFAQIADLIEKYL